MLLFIIGGLVLIVNLLSHQVINSEYQDRAENRTLTKRTIYPPRGIIYDRNGELLVVNQPTYELEMIYNEIPDDFDKEGFCQLLDITVDEYEQTLKTVRSRRYFRRNLPISFMSDIGPSIYSTFQEHLYRFPGFYPTIKSRRSYPDAHGGHVLGYVSEVNSEDINESEIYEIGDQKGSSGIERTYEDVLRGEKGTEYFLKDNLGREVDTYQHGSMDSTAEAGQNLISTLDIELQAYGEELMMNKRGSIVAIQPSTGEILAMVSSPSYDPNKLSFGKERSETFINLLTDTLNKPFLDRSLQAKYPPGSIFKPILALAALQQGITYPSRGMTCTGEYIINERKGFSQGCRNHPRPNNVQTALQYSCNTYFYQLMREFVDQYGFSNPTEGLDTLNAYLESFGLGRTLGVDLINESPGFVPSSDFYNRLYNTKEYTWRSTYILSLGIGQGELELTTLQMANLAAIIANHGYYIKPHVVKGVDGDLITPIEYQTKNRVPVDSIHFYPIVDGMEKVINAGTGYRAYVPGLDICGKTGTSQNPHGEDHSVFFGFGPKANADIAIAVFVENAGGGGAVAAPIGGLMIERYLNGEISERRKALEQRITDINLLDVP